MNTGGDPLVTRVAPAMGSLPTTAREQLQLLVTTREKPMQRQRRSVAKKINNKKKKDYSIRKPHLNKEQTYVYT